MFSFGGRLSICWNNIKGCIECWGERWSLGSASRHGRTRRSGWVLVVVHQSLYVYKRSLVTTTGQKVTYRRRRALEEKRCAANARLVAVTDNHQLIRPIKLWHFFRLKDRLPPIYSLSHLFLHALHHERTPLEELIFHRNTFIYIKPIHLSFENGV